MHRNDTSAGWAFSGFLFLAALGFPSTVSAQAGPSGTRVAWLDLQQVLKGAPGYAAAESTFTKEMKAFQAEVEKLQQQFDSTLNEYQKQQVVLSPSAKQTKETQLRQMQQTLQQRAGDLQTKAQQREQELVRPIEDRVRGVIEGVRAERNIAIIFDVSPQAQSSIIAADKSLDLTATILQRLKAGGQ
ncbi:MAG: OmpH family outer membrane protein [Gemmatimonadetes bacterium]|nr:OmpH family outer membrane protein [Gemmatimonadota bacterium]